MALYYEILFRASGANRTRTQHGQVRTRTSAARAARWKFREAVGDAWYIKEVKTTSVPKKGPQA